MTRRHFEQMAEYIRCHEAKDDELNHAFVRGMVSLAVYIGEWSNPSFDRKRFIIACELPTPILEGNESS